MSEAHRGPRNPMWGRKGPRHPAYGYKHTPEWKRRMSQRMRGKNHPMFGQKHTPTTRQKMAASATRAWRRRQRG